MISFLQVRRVGRMSRANYEQVDIFLFGVVVGVILIIYLLK